MAEAFIFCRNISMSSIIILRMNGPEASSGYKQLLSNLLLYNSFAQECDATKLNRSFCRLYHKPKRNCQSYKAKR